MRQVVHVIDRGGQKVGLLGGHDPLQAQIWDMTRPRSSGAAAPYTELLARGALDRKESAEDRLLAVKVQIVGASKTLPDILAQFCPARGGNAAAETAQYRGLCGAGGGLRPAAPGSKCGKPHQQPPEQFFDGPVALLRLGAREPIGEGMQRRRIDP